jgi:hypothetical protein
MLDIEGIFFFTSNHLFFIYLFKNEVVSSVCFCLLVCIFLKLGSK